MPLGDVMAMCWAHEPQERISFQTVMSKLSVIYSKLQLDVRKSLVRKDRLHGSPTASGGFQFASIWEDNNINSQVLSPRSTLFQAVATARDSSGRRIDRDSSEEGQGQGQEKRLS